MSVAAFRARKRIKLEIEDENLNTYQPPAFFAGLSVALNIIDEEIEAEAERQFTQRITNDPIARVAQETA